MDRLDVMQLFVRVVETGSFSKAAVETGIGQPSVSKHIAALEQRLGAQLLRRTTRDLSLTEAGQDYYESAVRLLSEVEAAETRVGTGASAPSGMVRVALSAGFGRMYVVPRLPEFFARYPDVTVSVEISERHVNLVESGLDVAIRIGYLADSSLIARRIGSIEAVTVATPNYLARHGTPLVPAELDRHQAVALIFQGAQRPWDFNGPAGVFSMTPRAVLLTNDAEHLRAGVKAGLGIAHQSSWLFARDLETGAVQRILADYAPNAYPIHAVHPAGRLIPRKVKAFVEFLQKICADEPHLRIR